MNKLKFLLNVLVKANFLYNEAIRNNAQHISGEIRMDAVKESYGKSYGNPATFTLKICGYQPIHWTLRAWEDTKPST